MYSMLKIALTAGRALLMLLWLGLAVMARAQYADTVAHMNGLTVIRLAPDVYMYSSVRSDSLGSVSANGLIISEGDKAMLIDAPWDDMHTRAVIYVIIDSIKASLQAAVITHAHNDRIGGIGELKRLNTPVYALEATTLLAREQNIPRPDIIFEDSLVLNFGGKNLLLFFPGPGHTADNIVVWVPHDKLLYAGCFLKEASAASLGNTMEANIKQWKASLLLVMSKFRNAEIVVPGHGQAGGRELFQHTLDLLNKYR